MKKTNLCAAKRRYEQPQVNRVLMIEQEDVLRPASWEDGHGGHTGIIEDDPEGDGKGAKRHSGGFWDDEDEY